MPARRPLSCACVAAPEAPSSSTASSLKAQIVSLSGTKYGHDLDDASRQKVHALAKELAASTGKDIAPSMPMHAQRLPGTAWAQVYTTDKTGGSSGKLGPFIVQVAQEFPASAPGTYHNTARLGPLRARLSGAYALGNAPHNDRVELEFKEISFSIAGVQLAQKPFAPGQMRGYWRMMYWDDDFRVFTTNKDNLFVLRKTGEASS